MASTGKIAALFLVLGVVTSLVPPRVGIASMLLGGLPYVTLFLATAVARSPAPVVGGGVALLAVDLANKALVVLLPGLLNALTTHGQRRAWIYGVWQLTQAPASTVFVLPIGWLVGALVGRARRRPADVAPPEPEPASSSRPGVAWIVAPVFWSGTVLVFGTTVIWGRPSVGALAFAVWGMLPYVLYRLLGRWISDGWSLGVAGIAVLLGEVYARLQVFAFPRSSTAALLLIFSPVYLACVLLPAGLGLGWLLGRGWRRFGVAGRGMMGATVAACLALAVLAAFRPDLLPASIARRVSVKERIGPPRVVAGGDALARQRISERRAWYQVGELGAGAGLDLAAIDARGVVLLDPATGAERGRIPFSELAGRRWNWFSRLVREGPELVIAQTGGGYQDVEVLDLEGRTRWSFHPDPSLPPIALLPRDLDGDGTPEFYAASGRSVYRLDADGKVVWEKQSRGIVDAVDAAGPGDGQPGIVVAVDSFREVRIWSAEGRLLKELRLAGDAYRYKVVEWRGERALIGGLHALAVYDLDGHVLLERPLGDFAYQDAVSVRLDERGAPALAVLAATSRDVGRWRLLVLSQEGATLYDEILDRGATLLTAPLDAAGRQVLLLASDGLTSYRRRP